MGAVNISKRNMTRKTRSGGAVVLQRYVLSYTDPRTGKRMQKFFERQKDAQTHQSKIMSDLHLGVCADERKVPTIAEAFDNWIDDRRGQVKKTTIDGYACYRPCIVGPLLAGTAEQRMVYARTGKVPKGLKLLPMLGNKKVTALTTADIRAWQRLLCDTVGPYMTKKAQSYLKTLMGLAAEDHNLRLAPMPRRLGRGKPKVEKVILLPEQVQKLLNHAKQDRDYGVYYAFPFLVGTRPSEQLGLLWEDVDFENRVIHIRRMQEKDGRLCETTKTSAGMRDVPMSAMLYDMMLEWKDRCPRREGCPHRVFPNIGFRSFHNKPRKGGGNFLLYGNFRARVWVRVLKKLGLPPVTPHSARHCFISTLQAQGVEIGLVSKLAGHANASITLGHYTHAVRGGEDAVERLSRAFLPETAQSVSASQGKALSGTGGAA